MAFFIPLLIGAAVAGTAAFALQPQVQQLGSSLADVGEATAEVAKATAQAIESETEMLMPVIVDDRGFEVQITRGADGRYTLPANGDYSILGAFEKLMSVPAHQAAFITLFTAKGSEIFQTILTARKEVEIAKITGLPPNITLNKSPSFTLPDTNNNNANMEFIRSAN